MTELEVLYKLERAYSRKWWHFWRKKEMDISQSFSKNLSQLVPNNLYHKNNLFALLLECGLKSKASQKEHFQTIRSAIAKLTEKGNIK